MGLIIATNSLIDIINEKYVDEKILTVEMQLIMKRYGE